MFTIRVNPEFPHGLLLYIPKQSKPQIAVPTKHLQRASHEGSGQPPQP